MDYKQLIGEMGALLVTLEEFTKHVSWDKNTIDDNPSQTILQNPTEIWENTINNLQNIVDTYRGKDA